jgi:hypothetical protein
LTLPSLSETAHAALLGATLAAGATGGGAYGDQHSDACYHAEEDVATLLFVLLPVQVSGGFRRGLANPVYLVLDSLVVVDSERRACDGNDDTEQRN